MKKLRRWIINKAKKHHSLLVLIRKIRFMRNKMRSLFYCFSKIDENLVVFESYMGRQYSDSPKAIYLKLLENPKYKFVWALKHPAKYNFNSRTIKVKYGSKKYYKYYAKAKYWVSNSRLDEALIKRKGQVYIQTWHGTPLKKLGYDIEKTDNAMNTLEDIRKKYSNDSKRYTYMISPSKYCSKIFKSAFNLKEKTKIKETGYPRNDRLFNFQKKDINSIKRKLNIPLKKKVILYAPTWRDNQHLSGFGYVYSLGIDLDILKKYLSKDYVILFRTHYFVKNVFDFEKYDKFIYDVSRYDDINDLYIISDMMITDYSSVMFDYANLNRPMIFYMYDFDEYKNNIRDFYIDIKDLPGPIVKKKDTENLCDLIKNYDFEKDADKYLKFNKKFNYLNSKNSSERVVEECFK